MGEKWKYLVFEVHGGEVTKVQVLDEVLKQMLMGLSAFEAMTCVGIAGWSLVSVLPDDGLPDQHGVYYFKSLG